MKRGRRLNEIIANPPMMEESKEFIAIGYDGMNDSTDGFCFCVCECICCVVALENTSHSMLYYTLCVVNHSSSWLSIYRSVSNCTKVVINTLL